MSGAEEIEALNQPSLFQEDAHAETGISEHPEDNHQNDETDKKKNHTLSTIVFVGSTASICLQIIAIWLETSTVVYIMGIIAIIIAPLVMIRQVRLTKLETVRQVHNALRVEVNRLKGENNVLQNKVSELQVEVDKVEDLERQLSNIARTQNANVNDFVQAVKENGIILKEQAVCAKAAFAEQLFTTVLRSDRDRNYKIQGIEERALIMRMKTQEGITLNEEKFRKKLEEKQGSVGALMKLIYDVETEGQGDDPVLEVSIQDVLESHQIANS